MTITAAITQLVDLTVPVGTTVAATRFTLTPAAGGQAIVDTVPGAEAVGTAATFNVTTPGDYVITAQAVDATGALLGTAVSTTVVIPAPTTITVQVPAALSASVA